MNNNDWLDHILCKQDISSIPNDGFTTQVMQQLPKRQLSFFKKMIILLFSASLGLTLSIFILPSFDIISFSLQYLSIGLSDTRLLLAISGGLSLLLIVNTKYGHFFSSL